MAIGFLLITGNARSAPYQPARVTAATAFQRGVALGLFASDPDWDYGALLDEIVALGATDVELVVPWYQRTINALAIGPRDGFSPSDATLRRTLQQARARGLRVLLFPILRIERRGKGDWRGRIEFSDERKANAWWSAYRNFIITMARAAQTAGVERLSVGSELLKMEKHRARWEALIRAVREVYSGRLLYSANWDHFQHVSFWDLTDEVGVTAYFELTRSTNPALKDLQGGFERWMPALAAFSARVGKPLLLTEVGYPALDGANIYPWDETRRAPVDQEEQRLCYRAFRTTLGTAPFISGYYYWNWFGFGGPRDTDYTPRGKPASDEIRASFQSR